MEPNWANFFEIEGIPNWHFLGAAEHLKHLGKMPYKDKIDKFQSE